MKLYHPTINVDLTYQNNGTRWLMVLEGTEADIELAYNGLYNFCAVGKRTVLNYTDHTHTKAWFWSTEKQMRKFFGLHHLLKFGCKKHAAAHAEREMKLLAASPILFFDFTREKFCATFSIGNAKAERPDSDFRDAVITHAMQDKTSVKQVEKELQHA
jgi:hypothetical protein